MAGKICGICGKYDAENEEEYRTPSGSIAKDSVSFAHSWILSEDRCDGSMYPINILCYLLELVRKLNFYLAGSSELFKKECVPNCYKKLTFQNNFGD